MDKKILYKKLSEIDKFIDNFFDCMDPRIADIDDVYFDIKKQIDSQREDLSSSISNRIDTVLEALDYKYGYVSQIISKIPELSELNHKILNLDISKDEEFLKKNLDVFKTTLNNYFVLKSNYDFLENPYVNQSDKEGIKLSLDSIKTILENPKYQEAFPSKTVIDFLTDYEKLCKKDSLINKVNSEYKESISKIWQNELSTSINEKGEFSMLVSMITGKTSQVIEFQVNNMLNRPYQHSCSLITNDFIATYKNGFANIGLIYPGESKIIESGYNDLVSNVFGEGIKNKEKSSQIATPKALIENGIKRAMSNGDDLHNSNSYNEVLVDSSAKPCGIVLLVNQDRESMKDDIIQAQLLSQKLGLPITEINTMTREKEIEHSGIMR